MRLFLATLLSCLLVVAASGQELNHDPTLAIEAVPPLPDTGTFPFQLVADDNNSEGSIGIGGATARQFLWFQQFSPADHFNLTEIWVLFPADPEITPGAAIQLAVYQDDDGDPTNGATLLTMFDEVVQVADDQPSRSIRCLNW